jgi:hypothetical protein
MIKISKSGGKPGSVTPSTALLNQRLDTLQTPRILTPFEIGLLHKSKREIAARFKVLSNG